MSDSIDLLNDSVTRLFQDAFAAQSPEQADEPFDGALWKSIEALDLQHLLVADEDHGTEGGGGGSFVEARVLARAAGRFAIRVPLVETLLAARWLAKAHLERPAGPLTVATRVAGAIRVDGGVAHFDGQLTGVPWGRHAAAIAFVAGEGDRTRLVAVDPISAREHVSRSNLANEPRETLLFDGAEVRAAAVAPESAQDLFDELALMRTAQIAGALAAALERSIRHATERKQFGRPISKFQVLQHQLARMGSELAAVDCAARAAFQAAACGPARFEIACARLRANQASELGARTAHQVHGAIGFTQELDLRLFTQRLVAWRSELGNDAYWEDRLGREVAARGADAFWPYLTARADAVALAGETTGSS